MKQTPIQKAISYFNERESEQLEDNNMREVYCLQRVQSYLQSLLAEERQMVEDAWDAGRDAPGEDYNSGSDYFTQTYQQ